MKYEFILLNKNSLPIFRNNLGRNELSMNICLDTGCGITTFYTSIDTIKTMYPNIRDANEAVYLRNASGQMMPHSLYIIPDFSIIDRCDSILHIKDLYCCLSNANIPQIDVLLSGNIFYNTKMTITPLRNNETHKPYRVLSVDTFKDDRDTLYMQGQKTKDGTHYICVLNIPG